MKVHHNKSFKVFKLSITIFVVFFSLNLAIHAQDKTGTKSKKWFTSNQVAEKVWQIEDHGNDNMFLVEGNEKALLIDAGLGVSDLSAYIKSLTLK